MNILLVEPEYRKGRPSAKNKNDDSTRWYPPLGLMKLARFHKMRGDKVKFVRGFDRSVFSERTLYTPGDHWERIYITTLFTFHFKQIIETINKYKEVVGGTTSKIFVGGIMATLMGEEIFKETGIIPVPGVLHSSVPLRLPGNAEDINIDILPPDYSILDNSLYAINNTYYAYTTRGCTNCCPWCGVPKIEPEYEPYIDIKPYIRQLRDEFGDKALLCLMDNNVLPSPHLGQIVDDLLELGYGRNQYTNTNPRKQRVIDFNQGLDATHLTEERMKLLSKLNIRPMRIAFDRVQEKKQYIQALETAHRYGVPEFSNYMLFNFNDSPRDLFDRLMINIELNEKWMSEEKIKSSGKIYSYPMRYAPIDDKSGEGQKKKRDLTNGREEETSSRDWLSAPIWTKRFTRNIEIMKGAAHGAISPTPTLARRTIGSSFEEFIANLYMPEELLRNRNEHEKKVYPFEPDRKPGDGLVEKFRKYILRLIRKQNTKFYAFHSAVSTNSIPDAKLLYLQTKDKEMKEWLKHYIKLH